MGVAGKLPGSCYMALALNILYCCHTQIKSQGVPPAPTPMQACYHSLGSWLGALWEVWCSGGGWEAAWQLLHGPGLEYNILLSHTN